MPKPIHIFRPGQHTAMQGQQLNFSEADLAASAAAYDPARHEAPLVIGHPTGNAPAFGWVSDLAVNGEGLFATPRQVEPQFAEAVSEGRFKKVSASFYAPDSPHNPVPGVFYLRHVGFLGAQPPAVKGLAPVEFADGGQEDDGVVTLEFAESPAEADDVGLVRRYTAALRDLLGFSAGSVLAPSFREPQPQPEDKPMPRPNPTPPVQDKKADAPNASGAAAAPDLINPQRVADLEKQLASFQEQQRTACRLRLRPLPSAFWAWTGWKAVAARMPPPPWACSSSPAWGRKAKARMTRRWRSRRRCWPPSRGSALAATWRLPPPCGAKTIPAASCKPPMWPCGASPGRPGWMWKTPLPRRNWTTFCAAMCAKRPTAPPPWKYMCRRNLHEGHKGDTGATGATPPLNNTVTSGSTIEAATANAVKTAYDKAVAAQEIADGKAPGGFGLGGRCTHISDWNAVVNTGFYVGEQDAGNNPFAIHVGGRFWGWVINGASPWGVSQQVISSDGRMFMRFHMGATQGQSWAPWRELPNGIDVAKQFSPAYTRGTIAAYAYYNVPGYLGRYPAV